MQTYQSAFGANRYHTDQPRRSPTVIHYPFWLGGTAAAAAAIITHPLDLVKVRLQNHNVGAPKTMFGTIIGILKHEGPLGCYAGLSAALLRQLTYSTVRFGVYEELKRRHLSQSTGSRGEAQPGSTYLIFIACFSGLLGGIAGNPADVVNVRMQSDAALPEASRRQYRNALDGLVRIIREEGLSSIFRGVTANASRAILMTGSQIASYDIFKGYCMSKLNMPDNFHTHCAASACAGLLATTVCSPVDVIKTRIMNDKAQGSAMRIMNTTMRQEGVFWMFRGWLPSYIRLGPQTVLTMVFLEQLRVLYRELIL